MLMVLLSHLVYLCSEYHWYAWSIIIIIGFFFFNCPAATDIYTRSLVGSVKCVKETDDTHAKPAERADAIADVRADIEREVPGFDECRIKPVSYTHLRAHETVLDLVCRLLLEKKKQ